MTYPPNAIWLAIILIAFKPCWQIALGIIGLISPKAGELKSSSQFWIMAAVWGTMSLIVYVLVKWLTNAG